MTKEALIEEIRKRIHLLKSSSDKTLEYAEKFYQNNSANSVKDMSKMDYIGLCTTAFCLYFDFDPEKIQKILIGVSPIFQKIDSEDIGKFLYDVSDVADTQEIIKNFNSKGLGSFFPRKEKYAKQALLIKISSLYSKWNITNVSPDALIPFLDLFAPVYHVFDEIDDEEKRNKEIQARADNIHVIMALGKVVYELQQKCAYYATEAKKNPGDIFEIRSNRLHYERASESHTSSKKDVYEAIVSIKEFQTQFTNIRKKYIKRLSDTKAKAKAITSYQDLISELIALDSHKEIENYKNLISKAYDEDIKRALLKYIYEQNKTIHEHLLQKQNALLDEETEKCRSAFKKYGIPVNDTILANIAVPQEEVMATLGKLAHMQITDSSLVLEIMTKTTLPTIDTVLTLYDGKVFNGSFLNAYPIVFDPTSKSYQNVLANIESCKKIELDPRILGKSPELFIFPKETISSSLSALKDSALITSLDSESDFSFLKRRNLKETITYINFLGHHDDVLEDINLLNVPHERWKRVELLQTIGEELDGEALSRVLTDKNFIVPDDRIDDYLKELITVPPKAERPAKNKEYLKVSAS